jgi:hypothetical protein
VKYMGGVATWNLVTPSTLALGHKPFLAIETVTAFLGARYR